MCNFMKCYVPMWIKSKIEVIYVKISNTDMLIEITIVDYVVYKFISYCSYQ